MNNYILEYYQAIKDGSVAVNKWIKLVYEYIVKGLEQKKFYYDGKKAKTAITFIENFCRHHEGEKALQKLKLELWQKALITCIFGIVDEQGNRQFREILVIVSRKNGKTLLASAIATYCAFCDGEYGGKIYFTAPKLEQANLCFDAFVQTIQKEPMLSEMARKRRTDIYIEDTNTMAKPLCFSAKKSDGLNISLGIADEVSSWAGDAGLKFYEVLKSSQGSRKQPLLISITTAGFVNGGCYDELFARSTRFLKGDSRESRLLPFIYQIDDITKWNDINELRKSNPNLNVSVSVDYLLEEIAIAEGSLSKKSEFLCKYCNIKQNSSQAFLDTKDVEKAIGKPIDLTEYKNYYAVAGLDLSRTTDLTCATLVVEKDGILNVEAKFFLPHEKLEEATARDGLPYKAYVDRGFLQLSGENFIDYRDCYKWLVEMVEKYKIYPLKVGYDRYCANYLVQDLKEYGFHCDDVYQGNNLTPVIHEFEGMLKDGKINIGDNDLLKIHLLNTALKIESESERCRIIKISQNDHIDGTASLLDALCVRQKWWSEIGGQLINSRKG